MGPNNQALAAIPATTQTDWTIQNNVYCSFLDSANRRMLAHFDSTDEARLFTAVALSVKLGEEPMCVMNSGRGPINTSDRFAVKYACWDLQQSKLDRPVMQEERFEIRPADETPLKAIGPDGAVGSIFLVRYPNNVIAVVEAMVDERALPSLPGASPTSPSMPDPGAIPELLSGAALQKKGLERSKRSRQNLRLRHRPPRHRRRLRRLQRSSRSQCTIRSSSRSETRCRRASTSSPT
jgi:hypothetical protein